MMDVQKLETLADLLPAAATAYGDRPALKMAGEGEWVSYRQLQTLAEAMASKLVSAGLQAGDRVILFSESRPEWVAAVFATWRLGATVVPLPPDTAPGILAAIFQFTGATSIITSGRLQKTLPDDLPLLLLEELGQGGPEALPESQLDIALLGFTSGSTSQPRAVELSDANLLANLKALLALRTTSPESNFLSLLPPAHLFELMVGQLGPLACGATVVYTTTLLPNRIIDALNQEKISSVIAVPALLRVVFEDLVGQLVEGGWVPPKYAVRPGADLANWLENECSEDDRSQLFQGLRDRVGGDLKRFIVGGSAYDPAWAEIAQLLKLKLETGYGLTEASPIVSLGDTADCPMGSVGKPLPGVEVKISPEGEVLVRGPSVMRGYFKDPVGTDNTLIEGWLHTGDKGELDEDGYLFIRGRLKEAMVTEAGDTIYPEDIEPYYSCDLFQEHCVVPLAGDNGNDYPVLCVVPGQGKTNARELEICFKRLRSRVPSRFRLSKMVCLEKPLPRTAVGKIQRRQLAETLQQEGVAE